MAKAKICGITTLEDARAAAQAGADMLGFNFHKPSPRSIEPDTAASICDTLREELGAACPLLVGVFVNALASSIGAITSHVGLDAAQLSGDESDSILKELRGIAYKAIQPMNVRMADEDVAYFRGGFPQDERLPSLLLDAYHPDLRGGTSLQASDSVIEAVQPNVPRLMLAGGLTPDNLAERLTAHPVWGVDVASGVEDDTPGVKNADKVRAFIKAAHTTGTV